MSAFGAIRLARTFKASNLFARSSQKTYLSNGSFTFRAKIGEPKTNFDVPRILLNPAPEYNSTYIRLDHLAFIDEENSVEYSDTMRCLSSVHAPTSGATSPSSRARPLSSWAVM